MTIDVAAVIAGTRARVLRLEPDGSLLPGDLRASDLARPISSVSTDSRTVNTGGLFVALRGERVDGHEFVPQALASGAIGCLVSDVPSSGAAGSIARAAAPAARPDTRYLFVVPSTLAALQDLASSWRQRFSAEVIGVTGSVGKTTAKEIVAGLLGTRWPVLKNAGNLNTEVGLPLTILGLTAEHGVAVLEMGMYGPGDIALLARIARPRVGVVTNVAPVHLERVGSIERIARAKSELVAALPLDGLAILNGDNPWTKAMAATSGIAPCLLVGSSAGCDYRAHDVEAQGLSGYSFTLEAEGTSVALHTRVPGVHTLHAFLAAVAAARRLGLGWAEIVDAVPDVRLEARQRMIRDRAGVLIIDDSYNASPLSMHASLELLRVAPGGRIAVLGDMLELGPSEESDHRDVGAHVAEIADWLVVRGSRSAWIAEAARDAGFPSRRIVRAESNAAAAAAVETIVAAAPVVAGAVPATMRTSRAPAEAAWTVLVKGSRGMGMEEIVERIRGES